MDNIYVPSKEEFTRRSLAKQQEGKDCDYGTEMQMNVAYDKSDEAVAYMKAVLSESFANVQRAFGEIDCWQMVVQSSKGKTNIPTRRVTIAGGWMGFLKETNGSS